MGPIVCPRVDGATLRSESNVYMCLYFLRISFRVSADLMSPQINVIVSGGKAIHGQWPVVKLAADNAAAYRPKSE